MGKQPLNLIISTPGGPPRGVQMIKFNGFLIKIDGLLLILMDFLIFCFFLICYLIDCLGISPLVRQGHHGIKFEFEVETDLKKSVFEADAGPSVAPDSE